MIRVYFLPVISQSGTEHVAGSEFIHDALLEATEEPDVRKLIQDTTQAEHDGLTAVALSWRLPTQAEVDRYHDEVIIPIPDPDLDRLSYLLANSPPLIPMPDLQEVVRLLAKTRGITGA